MVDRNTEPELALSEMQGDILVGLQKDAQWFIGFDIKPAKRSQFRHFLRTKLTPMITTGRAALQNEVSIRALKHSGKHERLPIVGINVGFSFKGLQALQVPELEKIKDSAFRAGLVNDSSGLGDPTDPAAAGFPGNWRLGGAGHEVDGILLITGPDQQTIDVTRDNIEALAGDTWTIVYAEAGKTRKVQRGHEHFGYLDGVSQPGVRGQVDGTVAFHKFLQPSQNPEDEDQGLPGADLLWPGEFVFGYPTQNPTAEYDERGPVADGGLPWMKNGSLMTFRRLSQLVPEFNDFVDDAAELLEIDPDILGARLVGRWKSGAPLATTPLQDDPLLAADKLLNNDFEFRDDPHGRKCPFAAHIRKAYPRDDVTPAGLGEPELDDKREVSERETQTHRILRRGIPFGHEVDDAKQSPVPNSLPNTEQGRGLMFVCYQTSIERQFQFLNQAWFNNPGFPPLGDEPGFDPLLGQSGNNPLLGRVVPPGVRPARLFKGGVPNFPRGPRAGDVTFETDFIVPTGGGYFFIPSISALKNVLGG